MKRTHFFLLAVFLVLVSCAFSPRRPMDFVYTEGLKVEINIVANRIGVLARDGVGQENGVNKMVSKDM